MIGWPQSHAANIFYNWNSLDKPQQHCQFGIVGSQWLITVKHIHHEKYHDESETTDTTSCVAVGVRWGVKQHH